jgi:hypothetical protein
MATIKNKIVGGNQNVSAAAVAAGGSGYAVGNTITLANGVVLTVATLSVSAVATVTVTSGGNIPAGQSPPANPQAQVSTNGAGTGATFNLTWVASVPAPQLYACDWMQEPFQMDVLVNPTGTGTYGLQYTLDDVMNTLPANVRWINDTAIPAGTTGQKQTTYSSPITALLLTITALSAPVEWKILQS